MKQSHILGSQVSCHTTHSLSRAQLPGSRAVPKPTLLPLWDIIPGRRPWQNHSMQNHSSWSQAKHLPLLAWRAEASWAVDNYLVNAGKTLDQEKNSICPQINAAPNPFLWSIKTTLLIRLPSTHLSPFPQPAVFCPPLCSH